MRALTDNEARILYLCATPTPSSSPIVMSEWTDKMPRLTANDVLVCKTLIQLMYVYISYQTGKGMGVYTITSRGREALRIYEVVKSLKDIVTQCGAA